MVKAELATCDSRPDSRPSPLVFIVCLSMAIQALVEFGTVDQEDVDSLFFTDDPEEVKIENLG